MAGARFGILGPLTVEVGPDAIDATRFERTVTRTAPSETRAAQLTHASSQLAEALALFRGPALVDFEQTAWARVESERLQDLRLRATEARMDIELALGHHDALTSELAALVDAPTRTESGSGEAHARLVPCGRQSEALRAFQRLRRHLADELGSSLGGTRPSRASRRQVARWGYCRTRSQVHGADGRTAGVPGVFRVSANSATAHPGRTFP